jgi:hypothetical protein
VQGVARGAAVTHRSPFATADSMIFRGIFSLGSDLVIAWRLGFDA